LKILLAVNAEGAILETTAEEPTFEEADDD
jgi:hypothetical protein